jgi:hypothetical protein
MSDNTLTVVETVNTVVVTPVNNTVAISSVGVQGAQGATGATGAAGATGAQGSSGVVTVNAPITNAGTSSAANLSVSTGTTAEVGVLQLTDSISSTSTTTAATPNSVKTAYEAGYSQALPFMSGYYYKGENPVAVQVNATAVANTSYYVPFFVPVTTTFDRILVRTSGSFSGTASIRLGIYTGSTGKPTTVVLDAGTVSATAAGTSYQITINQQLTAGVYFLAANSQTAASTNTYIGFSAAVGNSGNPGTPFLNNIAVVQYFTQASVTGAFATASSVSDGTATGGINVYVRAA